MWAREHLLLRTKRRQRFLSEFHSFTHSPLDGGIITIAFSLLTVQFESVSEKEKEDCVCYVLREKRGTNSVPIQASRRRDVRLFHSTLQRGGKSLLCLCVHVVAAREWCRGNLKNKLVTT